MPANMQQSGSGLARRIVLAALLVVAVALVALYAREGEDGPVHAVQAAVMGVAGPVGSAGAGMGSVAESAVGSVQDATANPTTLSGLREQNEELRSMLASAEEYRQEVDRLRELLNMKQSSGVEGPAAHIIGRSANAWDQSVTIDVGSADGVQGGMTVMGAAGVIGQVSHAGEHTSAVRLLTDPNSGAAAMVQSSRANGIVRGSINGLLYLEDLDEDVIPAVGDVVVTSGLGGSYERGLLIGTIVSVNRTETDSTGDIIVSPNQGVSMFEEVVVVFTAPEVAMDAKKSDGASGQAADQDGQDGQGGQDGDAAAGDAGDEDEGEGEDEDGLDYQDAEQPEDDAGYQDGYGDAYGGADDAAAEGDYGYGAQDAE